METGNTGGRYLVARGGKKAATAAQLREDGSTIEGIEAGKPHYTNTAFMRYFVRARSYEGQSMLLRASTGWTAEGQEAEPKKRGARSLNRRPVRN